MQLVTFERLAPPQRGAPGGFVGNIGLGIDALEVGRPGGRRFGAIVTTGERAGDVVDLNRALAAKLALQDVGAPEAEADSLLPADALAFLRRLDRSLAAAREAVAFVEDALSRYDLPALERAGILQSRRRVRLCAPVPRPGKILGVAGNYPGPADAERGASPEREPVLFLKSPTSVIGPEDDILIPRTVRQADYEGELAAVIGRRARDVAEADALECVAAYTVANDVTARDFHRERGQQFLGKSCDTFCPLGPALVTADEISDPQDLGLRTALSGVRTQAARTKEMVHPVARLVAFASSLMTLEPGDVILTGTPAGIGAAKQPPRWLRNGDLVEVEIERIGRIRNYVREDRR